VNKKALSVSSLFICTLFYREKNMSNKKKLFSSLATVTAGAIAGAALVLSPVVAMAAEHGEKACKGEKHECKCSGDKKAECEKHECKCSGDKKTDCEKAHAKGADAHAKGEKSCGGEGKCSGKK
jgi:hypothetical protein